MRSAAFSSSMPLSKHSEYRSHLASTAWIGFSSLALRSIRGSSQVAPVVMNILTADQLRILLAVSLSENDPELNKTDAVFPTTYLAGMRQGGSAAPTDFV
jgi:hypothetical protein